MLNSNATYSLSVAEPKDIPSLTDVHAKAFAQDVRIQIAFDFDEKLQVEAITAVLNDAFANPCQTIVKATMNSSGAIGGWASFLHIKPTDAAAGGQDPSGVSGIPPPPPPEASADAIIAARSSTAAKALRADARAYRAAMVERHLTSNDVAEYISVVGLCVSPEYRCRGIGAALVQYISDVADRAALLGWIQASQMAHTLYAKFGFEIVDVYDAPLRNWLSEEEKSKVPEQEGEDIVRYMIRKPQGICNGTG